ncbi:MAG TPA: hypothetical protein VFI95_22015 [Terriglobales bacterium]|nr:hypothetical protein [Terriglobales bacterium]
MQKLWNWILVFSGLVCFSGLLFLPAALNPQGKDTDLLSTGFALFATGCLLAGMSFYFKGRAIRTQIEADPNLAAVLSAKKRKTNCDQCRRAAAVIQCTMHKVSLCGPCLTQHYDFRSCVYVPALRKSSLHSKASAAAR